MDILAEIPPEHERLTKLNEFVEELVMESFQAYVYEMLSKLMVADQEAVLDKIKSLAMLILDWLVHEGSIPRREWYKNEQESIEDQLKRYFEAAKKVSPLDMVKALRDSHEDFINLIKPWN